VCELDVVKTKRARVLPLPQVDETRGPIGGNGEDKAVRLPGFADLEITVDPAGPGDHAPAGRVALAPRPKPEPVQAARLQREILRAPKKGILAVARDGQTPLAMVAGRRPFPLFPAAQRPTVRPIAALLESGIPQQVLSASWRTERRGPQTKTDPEDTEKEAHTQGLTFPV
jgi:hypothetical protein